MAELLNSFSAGSGAITLTNVAIVIFLWRLDRRVLTVETLVKTLTRREVEPAQERRSH